MPCGLPVCPLTRRQIIAAVACRVEPGRHQRDLVGPTPRPADVRADLAHDPGSWPCGEGEVIELGGAGLGLPPFSQVIMVASSGEPPGPRQAVDRRGPPGAWPHNRALLRRLADRLRSRRGIRHGATGPRDETGARPVPPPLV
jgi:hypothetical protein